MPDPPRTIDDLPDYIQRIVRDEVTHPEGYASETLCYTVQPHLGEADVEAVINSTRIEGWLAIKGDALASEHRTIFVHIDYDNPADDGNPVLVSVPGDEFYEYFARESSVPWADARVEAAWEISPIEAASTDTTDSANQSILRVDDTAAEKCAVCRMRTQVRYRFQGDSDDLGACAGCFLDTLIDDNRRVTPLA